MIVHTVRRWRATLVSEAKRATLNASPCSLVSVARFVASWLRGFALLAER